MIDTEMKRVVTLKAIAILRLIKISYRTGRLMIHGRDVLQGSPNYFCGICDRLTNIELNDARWHLYFDLDSYMGHGFNIFDSINESIMRIKDAKPEFGCYAWHKLDTFSRIKFLSEQIDKLYKDLEDLK